MIFVLAACNLGMSRARILGWRAGPRALRAGPSPLPVLILIVTDGSYPKKRNLLNDWWIPHKRNNGWDMRRFAKETQCENRVDLDLWGHDIKVGPPNSKNKNSRCSMTCRLRRRLKNILCSRTCGTDNKLRYSIERKKLQKYVAGYYPEENSWRQRKEWANSSNTSTNYSHIHFTLFFNFFPGLTSDLSHPPPIHDHPTQQQLLQF